jgi:tripartite-type tricarboxylate transporter receptor subunit TctC
MTPRRALLSAPLLWPAAARAWAPTRRIELIAGFAPGGGSDIIARTIAEACAPLFPVPLVVINRPGGGGALAAEQVARLPPDGHTLLLAGGSESTSIPAHRAVPYDPRRGFSAVIRLTRHNQFIVTRRAGHADMAAVLAAARGAAGRVTHASAGVGTLSHSLFVLVEREARVEFTHVPFTGGGPSAQAVLAGTVDLACLAPEEMAGLVQSGDLRPLAVASPERAPGYPDVPTLRELGLAVELENMKGWVGPAGLSPEIIAYHHERFRAGMATPIWRRFLERSGEPDGYADGPGFQAAMDALLDSITAAIRRPA